MNKKGFTLIELLAVIAILAALVVLIGIQVTKITSKAKKDIKDSENDSIIKAAENWSAANMFAIDNGNCESISVDTLISEGYLNKFEDIDTSSMSVNICYSSNKYTYTIVNGS